MEKFIPKEKLSKKKRRELDTQKRVMWTMSPVTRRSDNPKAYNRRRTQQWKKEFPPTVSSLFKLRIN